ncbi:MAG TPA: hypothetical protein VNU02_23600, partial [Candidatus Dormibacteraeota bacterium]|nr:hypothetical protein [Candidatus Dormibacteraeota bacterium]
IGYALHLGVHILEVPISAMLILSLDTRTAAVSRIVETLIGTGVGMLGGLIFAPLRVQPAEEAIDDLSRDLAGLLEQIATDLAVGPLGRTRRRTSGAGTSHQQRDPAGGPRPIRGRGKHADEPAGTGIRAREGRSPRRAGNT